MARKKKHEEHENHERWLVSYADFITLLFAFFVVMYSISSVNEGKYRVLSESMQAAFRSSARSLQPIQVGQLARTPRTQSMPVEVPAQLNFRPIVLETVGVVSRPDTSMSVDEAEWGMDQAAQQMSYIADEIEGALDALIAEELISVRRDRLWLEVEINTNILFASANAEPSTEAELILGRLAQSLAEYPNRIHVEGFTDNRPISSPVYPSNWELSSARAAAVVRLFVDYGIEPTRLASVGYGEYKPVADNSSEEGRAQNRRVVIVILANFQNQTDESSFTDITLFRQQLDNELAL